MKIITISRQYGAGGREIGLAVGKELGVTLYDRDIIAATAKASSIDASQIEREGEEISATESILRNITRISGYLNTTDTAEIVRAMKKKDRARRSYYEHYTGQHWGDCHNYDITLNSGSLGVEACVQLICAAVKAAENK